MSEDSSALLKKRVVTKIEKMMDGEMDRELEGRKNKKSLAPNVIVALNPKQPPLYHKIVIHLFCLKNHSITILSSWIMNESVR